MDHNSQNLDKRTPFHYKLLERPELLRVLKLNRASLTDDDVPTCILQQVDRHNSQVQLSWIAISYRWGDANDLVPLLMMELEEGETLEGRPPTYCLAHVPRSCLDMLRILYRLGHIRDEGVWVDFLCINQQDTEEKNVQVKLMGQVYELSARTIVFTGTESPSTSLAMVFWKKLANLYGQESLAPDEKGFLIPADDVLAATDTRPNSPEWLAVKEMLTRPWFGRLWVMQEAVLPRDLLFVWGPHCLTWTELSAFQHWDHRSDLTALMGRSDRVWRSISTLKKIYHLRNNRAGAISNGWKCSLSYALYQCDASVSFDPRDRIYGLLGMLHGKGSDVDITPNYGPENTAARVFTDATASWTARNDSFDLLYSAGIGWPRQTAGLPSWVPDYTQSLQQYPGAHCCAGKENMSFEHLEPFRFSKDNKEIHIQAYIVDVVSSVLDVARLPRDGKIDQHAVRYPGVHNDPVVSAYLKQLIRFVERFEAPPWTPDVLDHFVRTVTHNSMTNSPVDGGRAAPAEFITAFVALGLQQMTESRVPRPNEASIRREIVGTRLQRQQLLASVAGYMDDHTVCFTEGESIALIPALTCPGDVIVICPGSRVPFVWRQVKMPPGEQVSQVECYEMVGSCYSHSLNKGVRAADMDIPLQSFVLV